ncbi:unnamed protein product, partial [marine sediment metagenome]
ELETGGFYAEPQEDGTFRLEIPGFDLTSDKGYPSLPIRRSWVEAVAGRNVKLVSVEVFDKETFKDLQPAVVEPVVEANSRGTVRAARNRKRRSQRTSAGVYPEKAAQVLSVGYQEDKKKALVEMAPLTWDAKLGRLVLAHRLVVRLAFTGRDRGDSVRDGWRARSYRK